MKSTNTVLFDDGRHCNVLIGDCAPADSPAVQSNQHLVRHGDEAVLLDPGGRQLQAFVLPEVQALLGGARLRYVFISHQDPDCLAGLRDWIHETDADVLIPEVWSRFLPHLGLNTRQTQRIRGVPDEGARIRLGGSELLLLPAHFLHSEGNLQLFDPVAQILYSGDLGSSFGQAYDQATDFDAHVAHMLPFHRRYMVSNRALRAWAGMVRQLQVATIAPQHGAWFRQPLVSEFLAWCEVLTCGQDLLPEVWALPSAELAAD